MIEHLAHAEAILKAPLGTLVHLGAGDGGRLASIERLRPRRAWLLEGDPDQAARLRRAARPLSWAEPVETIVSSESGEIRWQQLNLARYSGPGTFDALRSRYPRLQIVSETTRVATSLSELPIFQEPRTRGAADLLVVDLPLQALRLLASLKPVNLQRFDWVLVRGCLGAFGTADAPTAIEQLLNERFYRPVKLPAGADPLWPPLLFRLDRPAVEIDRLRHTVEALRAERVKAQEREGELRNALRKLQEERQALAETDVRARAALRADRDRLAAQLEALNLASQDIENTPDRRPDTRAGTDPTPLASANSLAPAYAPVPVPAPAIEVEALSGSMPKTTPSSAPDDVAALRAVVANTDRLATGLDTVVNTYKRLRKDMTAMRRSLATALRQEVANMTRQVEAHAGILHHLGKGPLLPDLHSWAVSADYAHRMLSLLASKRHALVVEFGSGTSTALLSLALQRQRDTEPDRTLPRLLSLEHDPEYHRRTSDLLAELGCAGVGRLELAPLAPFMADDGQVYRFYDGHTALSEVVAQLVQDHPLHVLALVDGPPAATGPQARYPALPLLRRALPAAHLDILMDDTKRTDEQAIAERWTDELRRAGYTVDVSELDFEKRGCLMRATPPQAAAP